MNRRALIPILAGALLLSMTGGCAYRLAPHSDLLVGEPSRGAAPPSPGDVQITYLGTSGYLVRSHSTALLIDPYLSRFDMRTALFNAPVSPSPSAIAYAVEQANLPQRVDGYLVTHSHFDHLFDVPALHRRLGGQAIVSPTGAYLCEAAGVSPRHLLPSLPGKIYRVGEAKVRVLDARHDRVLGSLPYPGTIDAPLNSPPTRPKDWRLGTPLAFLIEIEGQRIYVESGGVPGHVPPVSGVDLAIVGVAVKDSQNRYPDAVRALGPRFVLPSHQDNFFLPLDQGFHFSSLSNFPRILAIHRAENLPGKLILMDYFHTFTLDGR